MAVSEDTRALPLIAIKLLHTVVWAFMAGCIIALPVLALAGRFVWVVVLTAIVVCECLVLAFNGGRCPLTDWAARYVDQVDTGVPADNFDIYLPNWLAKHNKLLFGTLFLVNEAIVLWCWIVSP